MSGPTLPCAPYVVLQEARHLAAELPKCPSDAFPSLQAQIADRRRILSFLPVNIVHEILNHDEDVKEPLLELKGTFGVVAKTNLTDVFTYLPLEIIHDIVTQRSIIKDNLKKLKGPFGEFAQRITEITVTMNGAFESSNASDYFQLTDLHQLNRIKIEHISLHFHSYNTALRNTRWDTSPTLRLALQSQYDSIYISNYGAPTQMVEQIFEDLPDFVPAKTIRVFLNFSLCPPLMGYLKRALAQSSKEGLELSYYSYCSQGHEYSNLVKAMIAAFQQGRLIKGKISNDLNLEQVKQIFECEEFVANFEEAKFTTYTSLEDSVFANYMKELGATVTNSSEHGLYKITKQHYTLNICALTKYGIVKCFQTVLTKNRKTKQNNSMKPVSKKRGVTDTSKAPAKRAHR
ncbi:hypothetical protein L596_027215 [Steinernema carpocapsae]|uniref:Uncharacterized protein n=1 Tax=Steinernema carpocapsae TaxID=34508 RepID=A0A4V5ZYF7_STECR|nr:hypothetical protein L596_027215 [Steinernema carpocapsae]